MPSDLRTQSNSAIAMAFGMCVQSTPGTLPVGALSALAGELQRRGLYHEMLAVLGLERSRAVTLQISVDKMRVRTAAAR